MGTHEQEKRSKGHQIAQSQLRASVRSWRKKKTTAPSRQASPCPTWTNDIHISVYQKEWTGGVWWIAIAKGRKRHQTGSQRAGLEDCSWDKPMHKVQPPGWVLPPTWDAPGSKPTVILKHPLGISVTPGVSIYNDWIHNAPSPPVTASVDQYFFLHFRLLCNTALYVTPVASGVSCYHWVLCKALWDARGCQWLYTSKSLMLLEHRLQTMVARR